MATARSGRVAASTLTIELLGITVSQPTMFLKCLLDHFVGIVLERLVLTSAASPYCALKNETPPCSKYPPTPTIPNNNTLAHVSHSRLARERTQSSSNDSHTIRLQVSNHIIPVASWLDISQPSAAIIRSSSNFTHCNEDPILNASMSWIWVMAATLDGKVDVRIIVQYLDNCSHFRRGGWEDHARWLEVTERGGPVSLGLIDVSQVDGP